MFKKIKNLFYTQGNLIFLKEPLTKELNSKISRLYRSKEEFNHDAAKTLNKEINNIQSDLRRVKLITSICNIFIYNLIYKREVVAKKLHYLKKLSEGKSKKYKEFFEYLKIDGKTIENVIYKLGEEIKVINKKLKKRNSLIYIPFVAKSSFTRETKGLYSTYAYA